MMGGALAVQGQFSAGKRLLEQAMPVLERAGAWREWCLSCGYLGASVAACGEYERGVALAQQSVDRALESRGWYLIAMTHTLLSSVFLINDRTHDVRASAQAALDAGERSDERVILYLGLGFRGWAEGKLGEYEAAIASLEQSRQIGAGLGQPLLLDDWFAVARADVELAAGHIDRAVTLAEEATTAAEHAGGLFSGGLAHHVWAQALAAATPPRWDAARAHLATSLDLLKSGDARLPVAHAQMTYGDVCRGDRDLAAALEHYRAAAAQFEASGLDDETRRARAAVVDVEQQLVTSNDSE
jgi:tetratricopeptide (TPR) repeat protein